MAHWRLARCSGCGGHGLVSAYTFDGSDFLGAAECRDCGGSGSVFVSDNDRLAEYPGGRLLGSAPGLFEKLGPDAEYDGRTGYTVGRLRQEIDARHAEALEAAR